MMRLWQSLAQRISWALRKMEIEGVENMLESLKRQYHKIENAETEAAFWRSIEWDLKQSRRWGRWEGADVARSILKPFVRTEAK